MASNGSSAKSSKETSDEDGFTLQLSGQNVEPDLMLAATDKECREVSSTQLSAHAGVEGANQLEWGLPCHSLVLSGRSHVFAASQHDAECTKSEKTKGGKRLVRLPMDEEAATFFLKYCYGTLTIFLGLPWTAAVLVARVSNMLDMPGLTGLCDQAIDKYFGEVTKQCTEGCGVNCVRFRQDDISPDPGLRSVRVKEMDIIDFCTLASETGMLLVLADCVKLILKTGGTAIQVLHERRGAQLPGSVLCYVGSRLSEVHPNAFHIARYEDCVSILNALKRYYD